VEWPRWLALQAEPVTAEQVMDFAFRRSFDTL
jgi:hypothetical protein